MSPTAPAASTTQPPPRRPTRTGTLRHEDHPPACPGPPRPGRGSRRARRRGRSGRSAGGPGASLSVDQRGRCRRRRIGNGADGLPSAARAGREWAARRRHARARRLRRAPGLGQRAVRRADGRTTAGACGRLMSTLDPLPAPAVDADEAPAPVASSPSIAPPSSVLTVEPPPRRRGLRTARGVRRHIKAIRLVLTALLLLAVLYTITLIKVMLIPLVLAAFLGVALNPIVA